jgi:RNA polymerase subunit RPABC4/transcription elongation factor Spt4
MLFHKELAELPLDPNEKFILIVVLAVLMLFVVYFELKILRRKSKEAKSVAFVKDEAFNAVLTTRSVIVALQRQGTNTDKAQRLVDEAKRALQRGEYRTCKDICDQAKTELTNPGKSETPKKTRALKTAISAEEDEPERDALVRMADDILKSDDSRKTSELYTGTKLQSGPDGNYLSAKFEISTAKVNIKDASGRGDDTFVARSLLADAEKAFAAGSFTKALSLAIKSRKSVNEVAEEEAIKLKRNPESEDEEEQSVETPAEEPSEEPALECSSCGAVLDEDDTFCHKCGTRVEFERECAGCGTIAKAEDTFCRKCGSKID